MCHRQSRQTKACLANEPHLCMLLSPRQCTKFSVIFESVCGLHCRASFALCYVDTQSVSRTKRNLSLEAMAFQSLLMARIAISSSPHPLPTYIEFDK